MTSHPTMNYLVILWVAVGAFLVSVVSDDYTSREAMDELLESISQRKGLYFNFPFIKSLDQTNFDSEVRGKLNSWVIEFYSSWCGHCVRFMTTFKRFAADVHGWDPLVKIGAVDCSNELNVPLCRHFLVDSYPTVRFFPPHFPVHTRGISLLHDTVPTLRQSVLTLLLGKTAVDKILRFSGNLKELVSVNSQGASHIVLIVECDPLSTTGPELALDYLNVRKVLVAPVSCENHQLFEDLGIRRPERSGIYVFNLKTLRLQQIGADGPLERSTAADTLRSYFSNQKVNFEIPLPYDGSLIRNIRIDNDAIKRWNLKRSVGSRSFVTDLVFQVDIEAALKHTFNVEIPMKGAIVGDTYKALSSYLDVLRKYFPAGNNGRKFLSQIYNLVRNREVNGGISGSEFHTFMVEIGQRNEPVFLERRPGWIGCRGSVPFFRGFPCGLWQMFHALTVQSMIQNAPNPMEVLGAMEGYVRHFFGCSDCARNFARMATTRGEIKSNDGSVLWLWKAHNAANQRLQGDRTEDPNFPKVQFPTPTTCPKCHKNGSFDEWQTLEFLRNMYTNISHVPLDTPYNHGPAEAQRAADWVANIKVQFPPLLPSFALPSRRRRG